MSTIDSAVQTETPSPRAKPRRAFFQIMALVLILTVFAGFSPTYYLRPAFIEQPLSLLLHVHGLAFSSWMLLFFAQSFLIAKNNYKLHRQLGYAGAALALVMVPLGIAAAVGAIRSNHTPPGIDPRSFLVLPFFDITIFAILVSAGVYFRKRSGVHKRLMLLATIAMVDAAIARLPGIMMMGPPVFFLLQDLLLLACVIYDRRTIGRIQPVTIWGGLLIVISQPLRLIVSQTPLWLAFGDWIKG